MEAFLSAAILEEDRWTLLYLALALDCNVSILEAYWHSCYKMTCLHWDEETQSFRNRAFRDLLRDTARKRLVDALPTWQQRAEGDTWILIEPIQPAQRSVTIFNVKASETEKFTTLSIRSCVKLLHQPKTNDAESSFTVQWEVADPVFAVSIDCNEWRSVEAGVFPVLFETMLRQLIARFQ